MTTVKKCFAQVEKIGYFGPARHTWSCDDRNADPAHQVLVRKHFSSVFFELLPLFMFLFGCVFSKKSFFGDRSRSQTTSGQCVFCCRSSMPRRRVIFALLDNTDDGSIEKDEPVPSATMRPL